jgi:uncharacterized protein (TIGR02466 family)
MSPEAAGVVKEIEAEATGLLRSLAGARLRHPFFVPLLTHRWEETEALNAELEAAVIGRRQSGEGVRRSNVGGWHSEVGLLEWAGEAAHALVARMVAMANHATRLLLQEHEVAAAPRFGWKVSAWANLNHAGDWNKMHFHSGSTWSGTYYVAGGDPAPPDRPGSGNLAFLDPLLAAQMSFFSGILPQFHEVRPRPGLMVLFPSYLQHIVHPYLGERPRISIAFNLSKDPYP